MRKTLMLGALWSGLAVAAAPGATDAQQKQAAQKQASQKQAKATGSGAGEKGESGSCQCPMMHGGGGMMGMSGMGGGGMHGMMMGGGSCGQMMGVSDVVVEKTADGAILRLKAKGNEDVKQVQQMASMMKECMSSQDQSGK